jgi:undecaprenyl pyrophosphate synthase
MFCCRSRRRPKHYPNHIAIIPDGNRRHALAHYSDKLMGYAHGGALITDVIQWASDSNVKELSIYGWSEENWSRSQKEITTMLRAVEKELDLWNEAPPISNVRFHFVSTSPRKVPSNIYNKGKQLVKSSRHHTGVIVYIYFSYGFDKEHQDGAQLLPASASRPDLLIRTGGEKRLSNFCMSRLIYTELCFVDDYFPRCNHITWDNAVVEYNKRKRKYGH